MFTFLNLVLSGSALAGNLKAKFRAARSAAAIVIALAVGAFILVLTSVFAVAGAAYLALEPVVGGYQAALLICLVFLLLAALCVYLALRRIKRAANAPNEVHRSRQMAPAIEEHTTPSMATGKLIESLSSPVVISALVVGVVLGRRMMNKSGD